MRSHVALSESACAIRANKFPSVTDPTNSRSRRVRKALSVVSGLLLTLTIVPTSLGQASDRPCPPASERTDEPAPACFTAKQELGRLPERPMFWHLAVYPTLAAAERAKGARSTVVESFGKIWLFTIADAGWRSVGGKRAAKIGPLPVQRNIDYEAVYMQSVFLPGTTAPLHTHSGPEAFYTLTGGTCLETPEGAQVGNGPGHVIIVAGGPPMLLMATGTEKRRGLVLILHNSLEPATTMVHDWKPKGFCKK